MGVGEEDAVGGLPDGDLGEVGDTEVAAAAGGAFVEEGEVAEAAAAAPVEELEVVGEVGAEGEVEEADGGGGGELEGADGSCLGAGVGGDGEEVSLGHGGGGGGDVGGRGSVGGGTGVDGANVDGANLDGEEAAGEAAGGGVDLDAGTADAVVDVDGGGGFAEGEGKKFELLLEGRGGVIGGSGDAAAAEIDGGKGLEDVVELGAGDVNADSLVAGDLPGVLEEADAVLVEGDAGDGELGGGVGGARDGGVCDGRPGVAGLCGEEGRGEEGGGREDEQRRSQRFAPGLL